MLARDWYYNERRQIGLDSAVASIYDRHDDSDARARRAALTMLGVQRGWRVADIGCGNGVLACEAALIGAEVDAIDISPAMLALAEDPGRRPQGRGPDPAGGAAELRLPAEFLRSDRQRIHAASSAGFLEGRGAVADLRRAEARREFLPARHRVRQHARRHPSATSSSGRISTSRTTISTATASSPICATNIRPSAG